MKKLFTLLTLCIMTISSSLSAEEYILKGDRLLHGYEKKISGNDFKYGFPMPGINKCLILRGNKFGRTMEFETQKLPEDYKNQTALFIIPAAFGANGHAINLDMTINGQKGFTFSTKNNEEWTKTGDNGRTLSYKNIAYDGNRDMKGLLHLRIPTSQLEKGKSLTIKIEAENADVGTWFMVFTDQINPEIKAKLLPAITKTAKGERQQVFIDVVHFAPQESATIKVDGKVVSKQTLKLGYNTLQIDVDKVASPKKIAIEVISSQNSVKQEVELKPSKPWQLNFVQHSHTDIGYTRPQTDILAEHIRYIDYALDYCDLTDGYPEDSKFRWTCESAWAVEEYLQTRPASQIERLKQRVKEGRIELTGMLYNFDEMPDETTLAASLKPIIEFRKAGLPVEVAMQNDVNGIGWCFADYFADLGIKYLNMGTHGHRALICFDYPTLFRWQSPSGKEMLAYRAEHYNHGNFLGVEKDNYEDFEVRVLEYLASLEAKGYPYEIAQSQFSGYMTDNSPPSTQACENVKKWNEKFVTPKLRIAVASEFFKAAEAKYADKFPVIKGAWPDWWTDGFGAGAREAAVSRYAHTDIIAGLNGFAMAKIMGSKIPKNTTSKFDEALRSLLFYDEHTTGYSESVREPYCEQTMEQRALKESYAWEAHRRARIVNETMQGLLQEYVSKGNKQSIVVYNPASFERSGVANIYVDHEILPIHKKFIIKDSEGNQIKAQASESRSDGTYWDLWVDNIPALGSKQYFIEIIDEPALNNSFSKENESPIIKAGNEWYNIAIDSKRGVITSLYDNELKTELIDNKAKYGMGEFILEELGDRSALEAFRMGSHERFPLDSVWYGGFKKGEIYDAYRFNANTKTAIELKARPNFEFEVRLYHTDKRVELAYKIFKKPITTPESFYIAMPFELENSKIFYEAQGGIVEAGVDQIPGSANDWNTVQSFSSVRNNDAQIIVVSKEIPLAQFGNINTGRYKAGATPETSHIYSWPMNNYWVTNFNADQRGEFNWSYQITSQNNSLNSEATKFGWGVRIPLVGRVLPKSIDVKAENKKSFGSVLKIDGQNIILINMKANESENSVLLHLREVDGVETPINISSDYIKSFKLVECNVLGDEIKECPKTIKAKETKFVKVIW